MPTLFVQDFNAWEVVASPLSKRKRGPKDNGAEEPRFTARNKRVRVDSLPFGVSSPVSSSAPVGALAPINTPAPVEASVPVNYTLESVNTLIALRPFALSAGPDSISVADTPIATDKRTTDDASSVRSNRNNATSLIDMQHASSSEGAADLAINGKRKECSGGNIPTPLKKRRKLPCTRIEAYSPDNDFDSKHDGALIPFIERQEGRQEEDDKAKRCRGPQRSPLFQDVSGPERRPCDGRPVLRHTIWTSSSHIVYLGERVVNRGRPAGLGASGVDAQSGVQGASGMSNTAPTPRTVAYDVAANSQHPAGQGAPKATTDTRQSVSVPGSSGTQPQTSRPGYGAKGQQGMPTESDKRAYCYQESQERTDFLSDYGIALKYFPQILTRRERMVTTKATPHTLGVDKMYFALLSDIFYQFTNVDDYDIDGEFDKLDGASDGEIQARHRAMLDKKYRKIRLEVLKKSQNIEMVARPLRKCKWSEPLNHHPSWLSLFDRSGNSA
ncbi:hypothetical protein FBU31_000033 [Coemansia sp. 'formosensis']|nr:hypothetical protein FBU31_000033 [Coemansia sp. 'formosensis']